MSPSPACASSTAPHALAAPAEIGQIAGRAGRYLRDGTFGVTGERGREEMDEDLVAAVEAHGFEPVLAAEWRISVLRFRHPCRCCCAFFRRARARGGACPGAKGRGSTRRR